MLSKTKSSKKNKKLDFKVTPSNKKRQETINFQNQIRTLFKNLLSRYPLSSQNNQIKNKRTLKLILNTLKKQILIKKKRLRNGFKRTLRILRGSSSQVLLQIQMLARSFILCLHRKCSCKTRTSSKKLLK